MAELRLVGLTRRFGATPAVEGLDLNVGDGEFMTLLGPSGSGKTTVLRLIAGYLEPSAGVVFIGSREVQGLPPEKRDIGMVFQSYALFPHRNVFKNVSFGLERRKVGKREGQQRVKEALAMVRLSGLEERYPSELSGGQQQRVALARALVIEPTLLLLDEPLSNLDAKLRGQLRFEIQRIQRELGITTVLVTHDQEEALTVSDRIAVLREGRLQQIGTPDELYHRPANRFVADFVGKVNLLNATCVGRSGDRAVYRLTCGGTVCGPDGPQQALLAVRPETIRIGAPPPDRGVNTLSGRLEYRAFLGELVEIRVALSDGTTMVARGSELGDVRARPGETVQLWWPVERTRLVE